MSTKNRMERVEKLYLYNFLLKDTIYRVSQAGLTLTL